MRPGRAAALATALASLHLLSCTSASEVECPPGSGLCGSVCKALVSDSENCGACGNVCGSGETCSNSACVVDCVSSLRAPLSDRWGASWDGLERTKATLDDAAADCAAFGGRLPTATEIHRASAAETSDVGQTYQTNWLWTPIPRDPGNTFVVRMSDGTTSYSVPSTTQSYRCVCPPAMPTGFSGYACNGPPGEECVSLSSGNAGLSIDAQDRAYLTAGGAMWECAFSGGQLPSFLTYAEAIVEGTPNGTGEALHTADLIRYDLNAAVNWTGTETSWPVASKTTNSGLLDLRPFRCVGRSGVAVPSPARPSDAFVGVTGKAAEAADRTGLGWALAQAACWDAGGHLPFSVELGALVQQGLGNGSGNWLWTADEEGFNGVQFLAGVLDWTGTDQRFGQYYSTYVSWGYKTAASNPFRCIYYPVDPAYVAPTGCWQGCTAITVPGSGGAMLWLDSQDRTPAAFISAIGICRGEGGHLATERDYTEAIRANLAFGSTTWVHAADVALGSYSPIRNMIVRWSNQDAGYTDQYSTYSSWSDSLAEGTGRPYRCVWTNELR